MKRLKKGLGNGDSASFAELYDLMGEKLYRYVCSQLRSAEDAADVVQEVFVRLVKSHRKLGRADNLTSYVFTIARNECLRWLKRNKKHDSQLLLDEPNAHTDVSPSFEDREWIRSVLQRLTPADEEIVQLKIYSGLTFIEIGTIVNMPQATVATRYRRAVAKLAEQFADSPAQKNKPLCQSEPKR